MNNKEIEIRKPVWIALSDLWLDNEIDEEWAKQIAEVIIASGLSEETINDIFTYELAPFLYPNHLCVAGEWSGFDPVWVCEEASKRIHRKSIMSKIADNVGLTTYAARDSFKMVIDFAFKNRDNK